MSGTEPPTTDALDGLTTAVRHLSSQLASAEFPLVTATGDGAAATARAVTGRLDDHVLPRLTDLEAPAVVVVGGSTGAGKSTIVNSILGATVSRSGILRPTTSNPVLVCHPSTRHWFESDRVLSSFARSTPPPGEAGGTGGGERTLDVVIDSNMPPELALIDAPDIDSVVAENRQLADELLGAADVWLFVTTAARYSDAVPWEFLGRAVARRVELIVVVNRIPAGAESAVVGHMTERLVEHGIGGPRVVAITEQSTDDGRLPNAAVAPLRSWLTDLSSDRDARAAAIRRSLSGALDAVVVDSTKVAEALDEQSTTAAGLTQLVDAPYRHAADAVGAALRDGSMLRGEVLARWQDMVGTGELVRMLQSRLGAWRDRLTAAVTGRPTAGEELNGALEHGVVKVVRAQAADAAAAAAAAWRATPAGRELLTHNDERLDIPAADFSEHLEREIREWQRGIGELLRIEGAGKRQSAKVMSYGVNGLAAVLMVVVFSQTGGLTGAEIAIAGGSSAVGQRLLQALLGDQVIRNLAELARTDLRRRVDAALDADADRFRSLLPSEVDDRATELRAAITAVRTELPSMGAPS